MNNRPSAKDAHISLEGAGLSLRKGKKYRIITINPDLKDYFGHYLNFDLVLKDEVLRDGGDFLTLGNKEVDRHLREEHGVIPVFTDHSWEMLKKRGRVCDNNFLKELEDIIAAIEAEDRSTENIFYMYLCHPRHVPLVTEAAEGARFRNKFVLNLFWAHFVFFKDGAMAPSVDQELLDIFANTRQPRKTFNVNLCVDTKRLQEGIRERVGEDLAVQPMFSVTEFTDEELDPESATPSPGHRANGHSGPLRVCYWGNLRFQKGYDLVSNLVLKAKKEGSLPSFAFRVREVYGESTEPELKGYAEQMEGLAEMVRGVLSPQEYKELQTNTDISLIPYRKSEFYSRTTAVFSDSLILCKPVIVTADTWAGDYVEEFGNGETFKDGDVEGFYRALIKIRDNYDHYYKNCIKAKQKWLNEFTPKRFIAFIKKINRGFDWSELDRVKAEMKRTDDVMAENRELKREKIRLQYDKQMLEETVDAFRNSLSWKVTAPLRVLYAQFLRKPAK